MSQIELSYEDLKQEMIKEIQKHEFGYLATSEGDFVRVGKMRLVSDGLTLWCFTDRRTRKYKQIMANPIVGIADGNLQIEGVASLRGHPLDEENAAFIKAYKETQPDNYERSMHVRKNLQRPDMRVIEVALKRIALYTPGANIAQSHFDILNTVKEEAHRVKPLDLSEAPAYME